MDESVNLLRAYLTELRRDERFLALLRSAGLNRQAPEEMAFDDLAREWLDDLGAESGDVVSPMTRARVGRFVRRRFPGLLARFRGDRDAARMTMFNMLDARFLTPGV